MGSDLVGPLRGDDPFDHAGEDGDEGEEQEGVDDVEDGVRVRNLASHVGGGAEDQGSVERQKEEEKDDAQEVEEHVGCRRLLGGAVRPDGRQNGRDGGADVVAQDDGDGRVDADEPLGSHGHGQTDGGGAGLDDHGDERTCGHAQNRVAAEGQEQVSSRRHEGGGGLHRLHPHEEEPQADDAVAEVAQFFGSSEDGHRHAGGDEGQRHVLDAEGDDLGGDRRPDVGPHDDADGLLQGHQTCVDETDGHHRGSAAALDQDRDEDADEDSPEGRLRQGPDQVAHAVARDELKGFAHELDAVKEQPNPPGDAQQR